MKTVIIIGAGPAGLTAAYELLKHPGEYRVVVLEASDCIGGISKTVTHNGNRMDMGGHRFFSKVPEVNEWWQQLLPMQGKPSQDDLLLDREVPIVSGGPDPELHDRVMLVRTRVSRILFDNKFYDYPISLKIQTLKNMGLITTIEVGMSYFSSLLHKHPEDNLENFYINRFGKKLYKLFFEFYTENLWGRHPSQIDASWGAQRVKGLSISAIAKDLFGKVFRKQNRKVEPSLIEQFKYPKLGPGQLWEIVASEVEKQGGNITMNAEVVKLHLEGNKLTGVTFRRCGEMQRMDGDIIISSMPLKDLVAGMNDVPDEPARIAAGLPYRDYMTLGVLVKKLNLKNETHHKTVGDIIPDCWVYVQDRRVKLGRIQIYNNWSPYLVKDLHNTVWIGLEYFVNENDEMWNLDEAQFSRFAIEELLTLGLIDSAEDVLDTHLERVKKAYPAYFDTYRDIRTLVTYLDSIENLYCVGRNGQHRYNNIDHSMCTSFAAVENILTGRKDRDNIWSVNTEEEYHEEKKV